MSDGVRCMWMRGGSSKGAYFLAEDLPADRDAFLLRVMGSPDIRQIDGIGGADPLTSKVAVVRPSGRRGVDVDYLFLQVSVEEPLVTDAQNCGNILAGVGPFAIERGLVDAEDGDTQVVIFMENSGQTAVARVATPDFRVRYDGDARIAGVPGSSAPVPLEVRDMAGSICGSLLPSGNVLDQIEGVAVTMIDNGMPVVVLHASDVGIDGSESPGALDRNARMKDRLESIRRACGPHMNLGDVSGKTVPKVTLVSSPRAGGVIATRTFTPHRCHAAIGLFGAVSVGTACLLPGSVADPLASVPAGRRKSLSVEHPSGVTTVMADMSDDGTVESVALLRTARKLFDGKVFG
ncbi:MAG: 4-oxalomesaconate tautomerase [Paracoccaceae bacterium]|nr:4-oxalomesaconate tautomerase [Paracoccaceae bacterium]